MSTKEPLYDNDKVYANVPWDKEHGQWECYVNFILTKTTVVWNAGMFHMVPEQVDISGMTY